MALEKFLEILVNSDSHNIIIEADSELIIRTTKKICNGTTPDKVSKHWRLSQVFHCIHSHLQTLKTISFVHVKRKANMVADRLEKEGVINKERDTRHVWELLPLGKLFEDCLCQAAKDIEQWERWRVEEEDQGYSGVRNNSGSDAGLSIH